MTDGRKRLKSLLGNLNVRKGDVIFLHSSFKRLSYLQLSAEEILMTIMEVIGPDGTLVLPAYAWYKTAEGYGRYFHERPIFDIRNAKANIGHIPETFRLMPGVRRSLSYWWSVCAWGRHAGLVTRDQEKIEHYYGDGSSFELLRRHDVKMLGLGVSLNTTSLSPILDHRLGDRHTRRVFTEYPEKGQVIDYYGEEIETRCYWLLPEYVRLTKPSRVIDYSEKLRDSIYRWDEGQHIQFCYEFRVYYEEALRLGLEASKNSLKMPWLENYE